MARRQAASLRVRTFSPRLHCVIIALYEFSSAEIVCLGQHGIRALGSGFFRLAAIPARRVVACGKDGLRFPDRTEWRSAHLSDLRGKVVVLNFWATWCPPCVEETPALIQLNQRIAGRNGMVLGVSVDEDQAAYLKFIQNNGINYLTYRDPSKKSAQDYGTVVYPETYIIDRKGKIARKIVGPQDWNSPDLLAYFDALLAKN